MEGKEYREEEDDNLNSDSSDKKDSTDDQESDDFGLPEVEDADSSYSRDTVEDSFEDSYETKVDDYRYSSDSEYESDYDHTDYESPDQYSDTNVPDKGDHQRDYYIHGLDDEDKSSSRVWWILGIIFFILLLAAGYWFFFMRQPEPKPLPKPKPRPVVVDTIPKIDETPIIQDKPKSNTIPGQVIQLSTPNGRYYVIVASFIDVDLAMDYGNKLAKGGVGSTILAPKTGKGFYRLALADFESLNDATLESERLKSTYGQEVWVIRY